MIQFFLKMPAFIPLQTYCEYPPDEILDRPENEHLLLLPVAGYPAEDAKVPNITQKPLAEIAIFV
jgi:hypothetical protein